MVSSKFFFSFFNFCILFFFDAYQPTIKHLLDVMNTVLLQVGFQTWSWHQLSKVNLTLDKIRQKTTGKYFLLEIQPKLFAYVYHSKVSIFLFFINPYIQKSFACPLFWACQKISQSTCFKLDNRKNEKKFWQVIITFSSQYTLKTHYKLKI